VRIGELAAATGVATKTLRFYEDQGLLPEPERTPAGYRDYPPEIADRVAFIRHAQAAGLTLRQIREILGVRDGGHAPCRDVADLVAQRLADVEERLRELHDTRAQLRARSSGSPTSTPPTAHRRRSAPPSPSAEHGTPARCRPFPQRTCRRRRPA
jgi:DNA-binding transcriptional MerR regulator